MAYAARSDLILVIDEVDLVELLDDERVLDDQKTSRAYQFECDTANTSGHFENSSGTAVTLGPGNTAPHITTNIRFRVLGTWHKIDSIADDGELDNQVKFSSTLPEGVYPIELFEHESNVEARIDRLIDDAEADVDIVLDAQGFDTPVTMDGGRVAHAARRATVAQAIYNAHSRRKSFNPEKQPFVVQRAEQALEALEKLRPTHADPIEIEYRDGRVSASSETDPEQQVFSRRRLEGM